MENAAIVSAALRTPVCVGGRQGQGAIIRNLSQPVERGRHTLGR